MTEEQLRKKWPMDDIPDEVREFAVAWGAGCDLFIRDTVKLARDVLELYDKMRGKELLKSHQESCDQYLKWLDEEEASWNKELRHTCSTRYASEIKGRLLMIEEVKEKFLSLTQPQLINNGDKGSDS